MKPQYGDVPGGKLIDPLELPEEEVDKSDNPKPAPAPALPISEEEYRRLKEAARHAPARDWHAQEDRQSNDQGND